MRQSIASHRASQPAPSLLTSGAAVGRLHEKMKEFEAVSALERSSGLFLRRIESLGEDCDVMAESGQVLGQILSQWSSMFRILNLFLVGRIENAEKGDVETFDQQSESDGQRLVRIAIDDLQGLSASE